MTSKSGLAYYYKQCIDGIEESKNKSIERIHRELMISSSLKSKDTQNFIFEIIRNVMKQVCFVQTRPSVMNLKSFKEARIKLNLDRSVNKLSERVNKIDYQGTISTATDLNY
jgi:hypothetical protein